VLRCDDRGTAGSTGIFATATPDDFANDVEAQLDYLKTRADVDVKKIGLIGHSEGGIIGPMIAAKRKEVAFLVMMAGPGMDMFDLILVQDSLIAAADGATPAQISEHVNANKKLFAVANAAKDSASAADSINNYLSSIGTKDKIILTSIRFLCNPWMRWYIGFDPRENLRKVKCPVLAINGEKDVQVQASMNIASIEQVLKESGNKNFKTEILPGLNHLFQQCKKCSVSEYSSIEETMNPAALSVIGNWMENLYPGLKK
jgi:pimeloyl-ACP methyl ester carboxylesterase